MSTKDLPTADQPDNYTGLYNRVHIAQGCVERDTLTLHLCTGEDPTAGTYCTTLNPTTRVQFTGRVFRMPDGKPPTIGKLEHIPNTLRWNRQPLILCPYCLTMARVESEMISQRAYKVASTIAAMDKL
ncbi:hypothetical protein G7Y31_00580 [Corynebacterium lizhenjunii]|uniref:Uncharacterized protein n=1 Tax=Corynebacterium lizhenjunii TaxID=2709394 RepID=A0A7T0KED6_9CORY|nr:hypothetical protein [Corynebacterium lizhenjunii]QPK79265.1 hypothetical protein G7Y31_00580 [Corynebacterium lizhenjunii]